MHGYHESQCVIMQVVRLIHKLSFVPNQLVSRAPPNVVRWCSFRDAF